jgi:hypothetical protein
MKPDIYFFNPTCELAVSNGSASFMASANLRRFENELSTLPGILAKPEDFIIVDRNPSQQFYDQLEHSGFELPSFRPIGDFLSDPAFITDEKGFLFPWGWSPSAHKFLQAIKPGCCPEFLSSPVAEWRNIHRELYSRKSALTILQRIVKSNISRSLLDFNDLPEICYSHEQVLALQLKWGNIVVKAPWSSSGRGLQILRQNGYNQTNKQVISGFLRQQGYVVGEPWHEKVLDLSFQFFSYGNGLIQYRGLTSFSTDNSGHYTGNYIQELPPHLSPDIKEFVHQNITEVKQALHRTLTKSDYATDYYGWLGVDTLIFTNSNGKLKFHPCLEINCRFTMGAIALSLRAHLADGSAGEFRIMNAKEGDYTQFCKQMSLNEPLIIDDGKIAGGYLSVTPAMPEYCSGAWIRIKPEKEMRE